VAAQNLAKDGARPYFWGSVHLGNAGMQQLTVTTWNINSVRLRIDLVAKFVKAARPDVPVIMITAYGDPDTRRKAVEAGAEALLTKPIDFGLLRSEIDSRVEPHLGVGESARR